ncbi:MAG: exodeoxyribonuclease VII large subunit [Bacilli bacterium]
MLNDRSYLSITQINNYIKSKLNEDQNLKACFVKGEISNFKYNQTGHLYFSLKDETCRINVVMFKTNASKLKFVPKEGMQVLIAGYISCYVQSGNYQLYINEMIEDGVGNLHIKFEELKQKLSKEGLFDSNHKKRIPKVPKKIGIITASTGAAIKDILSTLKRRFPATETILFPSLVQGEEAKFSIVKQIEKAQTMDLDVLIIGRGGGSILDLWAFNEEIVARAVFNCTIPIISAVGHEVDFTICDFVSDVRAATPSAAAEIAVPNIIEVVKYLNTAYDRLNNLIKNKVEKSTTKLCAIKNSYIMEEPYRLFETKILFLDKLIEFLELNFKNLYTANVHRFEKLKNNYILNNPKILYDNKKMVISKLIENLNGSYQKFIVKNDNRLSVLTEKCILLNPLSSLDRGYSILRKENSIISDISNLKNNDLINIKIKNGSIDAKVTNIIKESLNEK